MYKCSDYKIRCCCRMNAKKKNGQFRIVTAYAMAKNIQSVLSPLLILSYVFGLRIIKQFSAKDAKAWFSFLYILLLWLLYYCIWICKVLPYTVYYSNTYHFCQAVNNLITLFSIALGIYHDKKFRNCLKKLIIIDDTLKKLGMTTDCRNLQLRIILLVLGWSAIMVLISNQEARYLKAEYDYDTTTSIYISFITNYSSCYINFISDLIVMSILGYIGLKFDQINKYLDNLTKDSKNEIKRALENPLLSHQWPTLFPKTARSECMTWIIFHLHSELRKVFREADSIFGIQMTLEMGCHFAFITLDFQEFFNIMFINNYSNNKILHTVLLLFWIFQSIFRLFFINYTYERVSIKANLTGCFMNKLSHTSYDGLIHENITQFLLQNIQMPLNFRGLGFFQFGFKFLYGFFASVATVLVILLQSHTNVDI